MNLCHLPSVTLGHSTPSSEASSKDPLSEGGQGQAATQGAFVGVTACWLQVNSEFTVHIQPSLQASPGRAVSFLIGQQTKVTALRASLLPRALVMTASTLPAPGLHLP